jgi:hypothetical protein
LVLPGQLLSAGSAVQLPASQTQVHDSE